MSYRSTTLRAGGPALLTARFRTLTMIGLTVATIVAMALVPRIQQDEAYHHFADQRSLLGIANFMNVASNLPFLLTGIAGLLFVNRKSSLASNTFLHRFERWPYIVFFFGVMLTCFGSAYYHLSPNTERLMWDRLPMSIAFMSLLAAVITERINLRAGVVLLAPLVIIGVSSVIYWHLGEQRGNGDLRPYILVQFYSLVAIVLTAIMFPSRYTKGGALLVTCGVYALAKVIELLDVQILSIGGVVSGHSIKHIVAAIAVYWVLRMLKQRTPAANAGLARGESVVSS